MTAIRDDAPVIVLSRTFKAPRELVFKMFTDPKHLVNFWGPRGFSDTRCEIDLRVGGAFRMQMRGPDGTMYPCTGIYREIVPPERIVYVGTPDGIGCGAGIPPRATVTMTFEEAGGYTTLTIDTRLHSMADRDAAIATGFREGWNDSFDRLDELLARANA